MRTVIGVPALTSQPARPAPRQKLPSPSPRRDLKSLKTGLEQLHSSELSAEERLATFASSKKNFELMILMYNQTLSALDDSLKAETFLRMEGQTQVPRDRHATTT